MLRSTRGRHRGSHKSLLFRTDLGAMVYRLRVIALIGLTVKFVRGFCRSNRIHFIPFAALHYYFPSYSDCRVHII